MESRKVLFLTIVLFVCLSFKADLLQAATQQYYCVFNPAQSTLHGEGGFAGCMCTTQVDGYFRLIVDWDAGTASIDDVNAPVYDCSCFTSTFLNSYLTRNDGMVLNPNLIHFPGSVWSGDDGLYLSGISGGFVYLYGGNDCIPIYPDCMTIQLDAYAAVSTPSWTYYVDDDAPGDPGPGDSNVSDPLEDGSPEHPFDTIQEAIEAAEDADTVLVWPGVYNEEINFNNKVITVKSAGDAAVLRTDYGWACSFYSGEGPDSVLSNFVIEDSEYGIYLEGGSNPTLKNLTIVDCDYGIAGFDGSQPTVESCIFWNNLYDDIFGDPNPIPAYNSNLQTGLEDGIVAYWKLDGDANDSVGSNDGTIVGDPNWVAGKVGNYALDFDGIDDYVDLGNDNSLKPDLPVTISAWIKLNSIGSYYDVLMLDDQAVNYYGIWFQVRGSENTIGVHYGDGGPPGPGNRRSKWGTTSLTAGQWYHVAAVVRDATDMDLYVNGIEDGGSYSGTGGNLAYSTQNSTIGGREFTGNNFNGIIDDVRVYNKALSADEIEASLAGRELPIDPLFADAEMGDYHLLSERGRYWPTVGKWVLDDVSSPCIDAGDPNVAPTEEPMPNGGRINMGAYGNTATASMSEWLLEADFNYDGIVNLADFAAFIQLWLEKEEWKY